MVMSYFPCSQNQQTSVLMLTTSKTYKLGEMKNLNRLEYILFGEAV